MKIKYALHQNPILKNPANCRAIIVNRTTNSIEDIVNQITSEGSILKETECVAVINSFLKRISHNLSEGVFFQSEYFSVAAEISGVFTDENDKFDISRHALYTNLKPGKTWKASLDKVQLEKLSPKETGPKPEMMIDMRTKARASSVLPGSMVEIKGQRLKVDETAVDEGVFFISQNGDSETKVDFIYQNYPKSLQFAIPENMDKGVYVVEVRKRGQNCKSLKTGQLKQSIVID
jgi:hypothetical protein